MENAVKVAISSEFLSSFATLPRQIQKKVTEFINKFKTEPKSSGLNLEKIKDGTDKNMCSARIDDTYRGILLRQEQSNVYLLLWVDHHDEAYEWARRKRCEINKRTGSIQIFDVQEINESDNSTIEGIFDTINQEDLLKIGVPECLCDYLKTLKTAEQFYKHTSVFPYDVIEPLSWIAEGTDINEVIEAYSESNDIGEVTDDLATALNTPVNMQSFVVVEGEEELRKIMSAPLEKWRIFLHPTQRKIVKKNYSGAARVLGGAGTGKTVVAMHRAKYLASQLNSTEKILFTTFTSNLASDIKENLKKICSVEEMRKIEVINLDSWVAQFLREHGCKFSIIYSKDITKLMEDAMIMANNGLDFPLSFYEEEWLRVVTAQEAFSTEAYIKASRIGRGTRLDRKKRILVWKVFENFIKIMKRDNVREINLAMYECKQFLESNTNGIKEYKYIIVDEGQDFSSSAYS